MKISKKWIRLCNIVCGVLLLALLLCQFLPFWTMPACNCTGECEKLFTNADCPACSKYYKWCVNLPEEQITVGSVRRDFSKEWDVSIQQYTWLPTFDTCEGVTEYFTKIFSTSDYEFMMKDIVGMPVVVIFGALIGAFFCFTKSGKAICSIIPLITGVFAVVAYLTQPIFQMGAMWQLHLGIAAAIILFALVPTVEYICRTIDWLNPNKA